MNTTHKQTMYKTAYAPMFEVYVALNSAWQDSNGEWIFSCSSSYNEDAMLDNHLFREHELTNYCL